MPRSLHIDAVGGVAGDMFLAALIDAGAPIDAINAALPLPDVHVTVERVERCGMEAQLLTVHGAHEHHPHRRWPEVRRLIDAGDMTERARRVAHDAFARLARAEGHVHGMPPDEVMFHEVGALDAIADICGVAIALDLLDIDDATCSPLPLGSGTTTGAHGLLPLPAPATLQILRGAMVHGVERHGETVTPTGAALVASVAQEYGPLPAMTLDAVGNGAGRRNPDDLPNVLRVLIGERVSPRVKQRVTVLETNLDDLQPELVPDAANACFDAGALDVWTVPVTMKHGRPGIVFSALARPEAEHAVTHAILHHTTALGVRSRPADRVELHREFRTVDIEGHAIQIKLGLLDGAVVNAAPEHRDCERVARELGWTTLQTWAAAFAAANLETQGEEEACRSPRP